ncbi:MAG: hypothetical protein ACI8TA_003401 [Cyclobacteriaceae bacterium]|jgi:hypothetical protein
MLYSIQSKIFAKINDNSVIIMFLRRQETPLTFLPIEFQRESLIVETKHVKVCHLMSWRFYVSGLTKTKIFTKRLILLKKEHFERGLRKLLFGT